MMTMLLIFTGCLLSGIGLFVFVRSRIELFKRNYFHIASSDIKTAYRQTLKERRRFDRENKREFNEEFENEADRIVTHYCNHVHGGVENTPLDEYIALKALKKNSKRN